MAAFAAIFLIGCGASQSGTYVEDNYGLGSDGTTTPAPPPSGNQAPKVAVMPDIALMLPMDSTLINGSATDPDGSIVSYSWSQTSGPKAAIFTDSTKSNVIVSNLTIGTYVFRLTVRDDKDASGSETVRVTVSPRPANMPPVANAGPDRVIVLPTNTVALSGSGTDSDGNIASYEWSQISGPSSALFSTPNDSNAAANLLVGGRYVFRLKVTDNGGATHTDDIIVDVNAGGMSQLNFANVTSGLFSPKCVSCHSGTRPKGMYDVSDYAGTMTNVVSGSAGSSKLYLVITDPMGHKGIAITQGEMDMIRDWINQGALN